RRMHRTVSGSCRSISMRRVENGARSAASTELSAKTAQVLRETAAAGVSIGDDSTNAIESCPPSGSGVSFIERDLKCEIAKPTSEVFATIVTTWLLVASRIDARQLSLATSRATAQKAN